MHHNHHYNKNLKEYARELRSVSVSRAEKRLWKAILSRKQTGERFLRQRPIDRFIVDFFCPELKLIIEVDGSSHASKGDYDSYRQQRLLDLGYQLVRFSEGSVLNELDEVFLQIIHVIHCCREVKVFPVTSPAPPQGGKSNLPPLREDQGG